MSVLNWLEDTVRYFRGDNITLDKDVDGLQWLYPGVIAIDDQVYGVLEMWQTWLQLSISFEAIDGRPGGFELGQRLARRNPVWPHHHVPLMRPGDPPWPEVYGTHGSLFYTFDRPLHPRHVLRCMVRDARNPAPHIGHEE